MCPFIGLLVKKFNSTGTNCSIKGVQPNHTAPKYFIKKSFFIKYRRKKIIDCFSYCTRDIFFNCEDIYTYMTCMHLTLACASELYYVHFCKQHSILMRWTRKTSWPADDKKQTRGGKTNPCPSKLNC